MKILPPATQPPRQPTTRRHEPKPARGEEGYQVYRPCLRWEFGFTCAFCLSHEADLAGGRSTEGLGVTGVEHGHLQGTDPVRRNHYSNCFYACRYCNGSRGSRPSTSTGRSLLNPTQIAWGNHFYRSGDRLLPFQGDVHAAYTHQVYDLDDPRKVEMRRLRRELITDRLAIFHQFPEDLNWLLSETEASSPRRAREAIDLARRLRKAVLFALEELARFSAVPADAPSQCRCGRTDHHSLPRGIDFQMIELDEVVPHTP
jgi:hypothetical protein